MLFLCYVCQLHEYSVYIITFENTIERNKNFKSLIINDGKSINQNELTIPAVTKREIITK